MNRLPRNTAIATALLLAGILLAACDRKEGVPAAAAAAASVPATSASTGEAPVEMASAGDVPADCDAYIRKVNACMDKLGAGSPAVATFRQQFDAARAQWATVQDKAMLASQCRQSTDLFTRSAAQMGCE